MPQIKHSQVKVREARPRTGRELAKALQDRFAADFAKHGTATIERVRKIDPVAYLKWGSSIMPKNVQLDVGAVSFVQVLTEASQGLPQSLAMAKALAGDRAAIAQIEGNIIDGESVQIPEDVSALLK